MRVECDRLAVHALCPERGRRWATDPYRGIGEREHRYQERLRKLLVRFYTAALEETPLTEALLRRSWSAMWEEIPEGIVSERKVTLNGSFLNNMMTDAERLCMRGATAIHALFTRTHTQSLNPVIVDEPFALDLDGLTIGGVFDAVIVDRLGRHWIIDWTRSHERYEFQYDIRHSVLLTAFQQMTGKRAAGVLVDYIITIGDVMESSRRAPEALKDQLADARSIGLAIANDRIYKSLGPACTKCPFKASCVGISVVKQKLPNGRPRRRIRDSGPS